MKKATLRKTVATELYKVFHNKMLWIALAVGIALCTMDLLEQYSEFRQIVRRVEEERAQGNDSWMGVGALSNWIFTGSGTYSSGLLMTIWPLLTAMAFGWSYNSERIGGVYNQIVSRVGVRRYFLSKQIAVFISGGVVHALPITLNLLAMGVLLPDYGGITVADYHFLSDLALVSPWLFCLAMCVMVFLWGGATACICHCVGTYLRHGVMVVLVPYALYIGIDAVLSGIYAVYGGSQIQLSPRLLGFVLGERNPGWVQFGFLILFTLGSYAIGYRQVKKHELV